MPLEPGARLDTYELLQPLDAGGMGEVWVARDTSLGRRVALKLLPSELTEDATRVARFQQEARLASSLNHPNICTIHALGVTPDGRQFIAMELIEGTTLRRRLGGARLALRDGLDIAIQMASALTAAHTAGVVHRDVKPENVIVRPDGVVKVLDFGLAKFASVEPTAGTEPTRTVLQTDAGTVMGTVAYMSPEQARGQEVDARTDVWSLGVVVYEMVAGRRPFAGHTTSDVLAGILEREPDQLVRFAPDTPAELQRIVNKALRKDREQRYQSMKDLLLDLQALRDSQSSANHGVTHMVSRKVLAGLATLVVVAAAGGAWWAFRNGHTANETMRTGPAQRNLTRLTFDPGLQTDATWSPDGRFIAYASDKAGNFDIWVQPVAGGDAVQVTKSPAQDTEPDWSPDGSTIVFRSERDGGGLFVVPSLGGTERRLTSFGVQPKWSPDGSQILFTSVPGGHAMYVVTLDGSPAHPVLESLTHDLLFVACRAWHPDGRVSFLGSTQSQGIGLFTVPLAGGLSVVTRLTQLAWPDELRVVQCQWTPSGSALVFEGRLDYLSNLWRMTVDPQSLEARSLERLTTGSGNDTGVALSRDGKHAAFTSQADSHRMWLFPLDAAAGRITGEGRPVTAATTVALGAALAPDGHRIAYSLFGVGARKEELWIEDVATGEKRQLARDQAYREIPTWSQDGSRLAYLWGRETGTAEQRTIAVRSAAGGDERLLSDPLNRNVLPFGWSPDGQSVVVTSNVSTGKRMAVALWPLNAAPHADKAERVLASNPDYDLWQASFSPNGQWVVFQAINLRLLEATSTLYVIPGAGGKDAHWAPLTDPTDPYAWADKPRWSPDGKLLYFWLRQGSLYNVWALRFDDAHGTAVGAPFQVTHFDSRVRHINTNIGGTDPSVSRTSLLLPITDSTGSIWMLDNVDK